MSENTKNRDYQKINYETNIVDPKTIAILLKSVADNQPLNRDEARDLVFPQARSSTGMQWDVNKRDTHGANVLLQYGLVNENEKKLLSVTELGNQFLECFNSKYDVCVDQKKYKSVLITMLCSWHDTSNGRNIHPGTILLKTLLDEDLDYFLTDEEFVVWSSDDNIKFDNDYDSIKKLILDFRSSGKHLHSKKKADVFLRAFGNSWGIIDTSIQNGNYVLTISEGLLPLTKEVMDSLGTKVHVDNDTNFNYTKLIEIIEQYKTRFSEFWPNEKYKWEAIRVFQDKWDIEADDFVGMWEDATSSTANLLTSRNRFAKGMISEFARKDKERTKKMFLNLFDEKRILSERIKSFKDEADMFRKENDSDWKNHWQDENSITTYLWLRFPDKYFIYKYGEVKSLCTAIESKLYPKKGDGLSNVSFTYDLYNKIKNILQNNESLINVINQYLDEECWPDDKYVTLMIDFGHFVKSYFENDYKEANVDNIDNSFDKYSEDDFLNEVYLSHEEYESLCEVLEEKKNIILQGPPGVGKTFLAQRLAWSIIGEKNPNRIEKIQFHQSYSYEDFVEGFRPNVDGGFDLKEGLFLQFCNRIKNDTNSSNKYFLIIDEINRGSMSKILGELFMLIEPDKRGSDNSVKLLYSEKEFYVPENLYIIGTMNTADRSLALIDYALRRRFAFFDIKPAFKFMKENKSMFSKSPEKDLVENIMELNNEIENDLDKGCKIGHSYFCSLDKSNDKLKKCKSIIEYEIVPLLNEYWYDDDDKVDKWTNKLRKSFEE